MKSFDIIEAAGWLLLKLVLGFGWTHAMLFFTPTSIASVASSTSVVVWTLMTAVGALVSIGGMALALRARHAVLGYTIEFVGIVLFAGGPLQYLGLQVGFLTDPAEFQQRYALAWLAAGMCFAIAVRGVQVLKKRQAAAAAAVVFGKEA